MQLLSVFLSATALLGQAASGYHLLNMHVARPEPNAVTGYARLEFAALDAFVVLSFNPAQPFAQIQLDAKGHLGNDFVFREVEPDEWHMLSRVATSIQENDITGPFAIEADGRFVYKGEGGSVWNACGNRDNGLRLHMRMKGKRTEICEYQDITIKATKFD
ncbi:uncharacterized protein B0H64DRAFT_50629 [Chaetomium fimeti]|uniref:Uncharacterized protein n=1 Tax=Chaetomium fimeti TaxID=1854472 RepID=A0AAE0LNC9_9PEZI|nr:hypothetical protein B0H64DRAFT_50629 [Chaetomium fimeti]